MVSPRGHSLVELMVGLVLLATGFGAVGASAVLGAHWSALGASRQEALAAGEAVLDSLLASPAPESGAGQRQGVTVRWRVDGSEVGPALVTVEAVPPAGGPVIVLSSTLLGDLPSLPDTPS